MSTITTQNVRPPVPLTRGKADGIDRLADERGVIAAAAMDQRGSLREAIAAARGHGGAASAADLTQFKTSVTRILTRSASAILMDPEFGLPALAAKDPRAGVLLAYEKTGYDATTPGRLPDLLPQWSVRRLLAAGADAIKILLYYNPFDELRINAIKHAFVERVGDECIAEDVPFFLEMLTYNDAIGKASSYEFAVRKPEHVARSVAEFTKRQYGVDVLKVEMPINVTFVQGTRAFGGRRAYTRADAQGMFRESACAATKPFIYLSAGVSHPVFLEELEMAAEAGTPFAGVLCGRATWQEAIPLYAREGVEALDRWLEDRGARNVAELNAVLARAAKPWWTIYER